MPRIRAAVCALVIALFLGGCTSLPNRGSSTEPETSSAPAETAPPVPGVAPFNTADLEFVTTLIQRQQESIELAKTFLGKSDTNQDVAKLAEDIQSSQTAQVETLRSWLDAWGQKLAQQPTTENDTEGDLAALEKASGVEAARLFLDQMIQAHQDAIVAAENELDAGKYGDATAMAKSLMKERTAEVAAMHDLKESL